MQVMQKQIHAECPTYLELELIDSEISTINGKELNKEGVKHVINYLGQEVDVKAEDVFEKVQMLNTINGVVTLKLHDGIITAV